MRKGQPVPNTGAIVSDNTNSNQLALKFRSLLSPEFFGVSASVDVPEMLSGKLFRSALDCVFNALKIL